MKLMLLLKQLSSGRAIIIVTLKQEQQIKSVGYPPGQNAVHRNFYCFLDGNILCLPFCLPFSPRPTLTLMN